MSRILCNKLQRIHKEKCHTAHSERHFQRPLGTIEEPPQTKRVCDVFVCVWVCFFVPRQFLTNDFWVRQEPQSTCVGVATRLLSHLLSRAFNIRHSPAVRRRHYSVDSGGTNEAIDHIKRKKNKCMQRLMHTKLQLQLHNPFSTAYIFIRAMRRPAMDYQRPSVQDIETKNSGENNHSLAHTCNAPHRSKQPHYRDK